MQAFLHPLDLYATHGQKLETKVRPLSIMVVAAVYVSLIPFPPFAHTHLCGLREVKDKPYVRKSEFLREDFPAGFC